MNLKSLSFAEINGWGSAFPSPSLSGRVSNCCLLQYEPEAQASGLSAQRPNLSLTKSENVAQFAVEPLACASGLYSGLTEQA